MSGLLLLAALAVILLSCEVFTNSIEWFGRRLGWHQGAVGSILAAVGTAMPETMVPVIAIVFSSGQAAHDVGIGAILGAPFMLSCLTLPLIGAVTIGLAAAKKRPFFIEADRSFFLNDLSFFTVSFGLALAASLMPWRAARFAVAAALVLIYAVYVYRTLRADGQRTEAGRPLYFSFGRSGHAAAPPLALILLQIVVALLGIVGGAHLFVGALVNVSAALQIPALVLSVVLTPVATELPEKFNSLLWISRRQDTLAIGNVTGAMVFQSTLPVMVGILFTPWVLRGPALAAAAVTLAATAVLWLGAAAFGRIHPLLLAANALFYAGFVTYALTRVEP